MFGKTQILNVFLELDNVKLVITSGSGSKATRIYAGQLSFTPDILRDAFIVDSVKFANQIKIAVAQKTQLQSATEVQLILPAEKTFIKTLEATESVESFLRVLPFFKEELVLQSSSDKKPNSPVTYVAFERKLVEELQQPFQDLSKKIVNVTSSAAILAKRIPGNEDQYLLMGFEKSIAVVVHRGGKIVQLEAWPTDVFAGRFVEYVRNSKLEDIKKASIVGTIAQEIPLKLQTDLGISTSILDTSDIYDQIISASSEKNSGPHGTISLKMPGVSGIMEKLPEKKLIILGLAIIIGFILAVGIFMSFKNGKAKVLSPVADKTVEPAKPETPPAPPSPEAKPADYTVRILNGTPVAGEASRLSDKLKALGFNVSETKNATNSGFVTTRLRVVAGTPDSIVVTLKTELSKTYESITQEGLVDQTVKVEIIIGKKL